MFRSETCNKLGFLFISTPFLICHIMLSALTWKYIQESNHYSIPWSSFHHSYLDYGNNLLTVLPTCIFSLLQSRLNPAAYTIKLIKLKYKFDSISCLKIFPIIQIHLWIKPKALHFDLRGTRWSCSLLLWTLLLSLVYSKHTKFLAMLLSEVTFFKWPTYLKLPSLLSTQEFIFTISALIIFTLALILNLSPPIKHKVYEGRDFCSCSFTINSAKHRVNIQ